MICAVIRPPSLPGMACAVGAGIGTPEARPGQRYGARGITSGMPICVGVPVGTAGLRNTFTLSCATLGSPTHSDWYPSQGCHRPPTAGRERSTGPSSTWSFTNASPFCLSSTEKRRTPTRCGVAASMFGPGGSGANTPSFFSAVRR